MADSALIELIPRIRMVDSLVGSPPATTETPAILPCIASEMFVVGVFLRISEAFTDATAPVKSLFR